MQVTALPGRFMWRASVDTSPSEVLLYTRAGCHLCEEALQILGRHGLIVRKIDIDAQSELKPLYDQCVPVVVIDGQERFRGRVDEVLLKRLLSRRETT